MDGKYVGNRPIKLSKIKDDLYGKIDTVSVSGRKVCVFPSSFHIHLPSPPSPTPISLSLFHCHYFQVTLLSAFPHRESVFARQWNSQEIG